VAALADEGQGRSKLAMNHEANRAALKIDALRLYLEPPAAVSAYGDVDDH
jgi:hypothetical protein